MDTGQEKPFAGLAEVLRMAWPACLSMLSGTVIRFVDALMVSKVSPAALAGQFSGGMVAFVPESLAMGTLIVVNTYVSQNLGAGRLKRCGGYAWAGIHLALAFAMLLAALVALAEPLFSLAGHEAAILANETLYFRYMIISALVTLPNQVLCQFFYGIHRPRVVLACSVTANVFNVAANYVLIFGKFGLPAMGLEGAAIGSCLSFALQFVILLSVFLSQDNHRKYATRRAAVLHWRACANILRTGWPAGLQFANGMLCWSLFMVFFAFGFGTAASAAGSASFRYLTLAIMPAVGLGTATTALVGRHIGHGRPDLARKRTHTALAVSLAYVTVCALIFVVFREALIRVFVTIPGATELSPGETERMIAEIVDVGGKVMLCFAFFQVFDAVTLVFNGALRGAGDTRWPMLAMASLAWTIEVGGAWLIVEHLRNPSPISPYLASCTYVVALAAVLYWRFRSGAWEKIDLLGRARPPQAVPAEPAPVITATPARPPDDEEAHTP